MYISSQNLTTSMRQSVMQTESNLSTAQNEVSSGVYADLGLQLGGQAGTAVSFAQQSAHLSALTASNTTASTRLSSSSAAIDSILSEAQTMSNALVTAGSSQSISSIVQTEAQSNLQSLIGKINTYVGGQYIFAGINTAVAPMPSYASTMSAVDTAMNDDLQNPATVTSTDLANAMSSTGNFNKLFQTSSGTGTSTSLTTASTTPITSQISTSQSLTTSVSANQPAFQQIAQAYALITEVGSKNLDSAASQAVIATATQLLSAGMASLTTIQANLGTQQNTIAAANTQMSSQQTILTSNVDSLEKVDPYTLSTTVTALQTQLQDSYSLTSQLKSLSLVNYLTGG